MAQAVGEPWVPQTAGTVERRATEFAGPEGHLTVWLVIQIATHRRKPEGGLRVSPRETRCSVAGVVTGSAKSSFEAGAGGRSWCSDSGSLCAAW